MLVQNIGGIVMLDENIGVGYWGTCYNICSWLNFIGIVDESVEMFRVSIVIDY